MHISVKLGVVVILGLAMLTSVDLTSLSAQTSDTEIHHRIDEVRREIDEKSEKRFEDIKSDLEGRDKWIDRWLIVIGLFMTLFGIIMPILAVFGIREFLKLSKEAKAQAEEAKAQAEEAKAQAEEAQRCANAARTSLREADKHLDDIRATSEEASRHERILSRKTSGGSLPQNHGGTSDKPDVENMNSSDPRGVINYWTQVLRIEPTAENYVRRGVAKVESGLYSAAIADYDEAIRLNPDNLYQVYYERGYARMMRREHALALGDFNRAIELKPDYADAYNARGMARNVLMQPAEAIKDLDEAIRLDPNHARAYTTRGVAKTSLKRFQEAKADLEKALELAERQGLNDLQGLIGGLLYEIES